MSELKINKMLVDSITSRSNYKFINYKTSNLITQNKPIETIYNRTFSYLIMVEILLIKKYLILNTLIS